jgi:hypothetical protein
VVFPLLPPVFFQSSSSIPTANSFNVLDIERADDAPFDPALTSTPGKAKEIPTVDKIKIVSINVNGRCGKIRQMEDLIFEQDPDIILFQEIEINSSVFSGELFPKSFNVYHKDRTLMYIVRTEHSMEAEYALLSKMAFKLFSVMSWIMIWWLCGSSWKPNNTNQFISVPSFALLTKILSILNSFGNH